jgi:hypothetical protein
VLALQFTGSRAPHAIDRIVASKLAPLWFRNNGWSKRPDYFSGDDSG